MARRTRRTKARGKENHWTVEEARQLLGAWERSGLTMAAFCRKRGIRPRRLYWWRSKLAAWSQKPEPTEQPTPDGEHGCHLVEAVVVPSSSAPPSAAVMLHLRSGDRIEVLSPEHVEADWLACLARGLSESASAEGSAR